jgi:hypothetical protein
MPEISTLPSITTLVPDTDVLAIVSDGDTKKIAPTATPSAAPNILATDANGSIAFDTDLLVVDAVNDQVRIGGTFEGGNPATCTATGTYAFTWGASSDVTGNNSVIQGGTNNTVGGDYSCIDGGDSNTVNGGYSTVGGGSDNQASAAYTTVCGGIANGASATYALVGGGWANNATAEGAVSSGGQVNTASGTYSVIGGGYWNTASGVRSCVAGGSSGIASGDYSTVAGGRSNTASGDNSHASGYYGEASDYAQLAHASGRFSALGDAQTSTFVIREDITHSDSNWHSLYLDGSTELMHISADTLWTVNILIAGTTQGCTQSFSYQIVGAIENDGGTTTVLAQTVTTLHEDDADFAAQIAADDTNDALLVQVQDSTSGSAVVRWAATVRTIEVSYPA